MQKEMKKNKFIDKLPLILTLIGILLYTTVSIYFALYQVPVMDEGAYLIKGYQFATGSFRPFEPYGFWTNKMVLGFYIWGWVQVIFSPGLLAPRLFAVALGVLTLVGTWLVIKRMGNQWLAAISVWAFALNPFLIGIYSWAASQILVICILTWVLVLVLGRNRSNWEIILASILSVVLVFTRENMVFLLPLLIIYVFWEHGKKKGLYSVAVILFLFILGHLIFWPEILYLWGRWIPDFGPSVAEGIDFPAVEDVADSSSLFQRLLSIGTALRVFLIPLVGFLLTLIFWPNKKDWESGSHQKAAIFLSVTYFILLIAHMYASVGMDYCVFCTTQYTAFFGSMGLIIFAASYTSLNRSQGKIRRLIGVILLILILSVVGYSLFELVGYRINNILLPRVRDWKFLPGNAMLWQILANKFGLSLETSRRLLPTILGFMIGALFTLLLFVFSNKFALRNKKHFLDFFIPFLFIPLIIFLPLVNQLPENSLCSSNVPRIYQSMANRILTRLDPGEKIFIDGSLANIPLIYIPSEYFFPPQVNGDFSFKEEENTDELLQGGYWNQALRDQWLEEAEFFIIDYGEMGAWEDAQIESRRIFSTRRAYPDACPADAEIFIFVRRD
jgi:hypothetical protein